MSQTFPLKGIIPPLVTPLVDPGTLDLDGLRRVIEHVIDGGVHGIFLLGSTGEGPSLSYEHRREVITVGCEAIAGRVPVLVGITDSAFAESLALARHAADAGADALVVAAPYYFPARQDELLVYSVSLARQLPLPMFLYNMPSHTKLTFEPATVERLLDEPNIVGLKDSGGQMLYFNAILELLRERPDFTLLMGPEELLAESVLMGGHGGVSGGSNLAPQLYVDLYEAAVSGDLALVSRLQHQVMRLSSRIYTVGAAPSGYLRGLKCAMEIVGLCAGGLAQPFEPLGDEQQARIRQHLSDLGLLDAATVAS